MQRQEVTLSGMLNFIDGLLSSCGDERIIVSTTNHKEKLILALLCPGRKDAHVMMSYCSPCGFGQLASSYLYLSDHFLFRDIKDLLKTAEVTPADVAEQLLRGGGEPDDMLWDFVEFLMENKNGNNEFKAKKLNQTKKVKAKKKIEENPDKKETSKCVLLKEIEDLIGSLKFTTAEIAEQLLKGPTGLLMLLRA
ncbi:hypothetical protein CDL15_Pgr020750 [Punica granatum]|uniref:AAA+ ATPase At3g28540-like C-terminal domain-containing protein n=1 Tax=Punica granatum TaxID=22663 RepID=A0A218XVY1_PUNGR|nr:hypothetical protein CDL15_Pgr020750 [Punica granatum]